MNNILQNRIEIDAEEKKAALKTRVFDVLKVSTVPTMLKRIMDVTEDPMTRVSDLETIIERDQAVASRVVGVSNAVFYGFPRKISTIPQAILVLGFDMVKGLAISTTAFNIVPGTERDSLVELWHHSFEVAAASAIVARRSGLVNKDTAFLAGLIHDIGRALMFQVCGKDYLAMTTAENEWPEEEAYGASHAEAGAWFADRCKFPEDCVEAIMYHHCPEKRLESGKKLPPLAAIVYTANLLASGWKAVCPVSSAHGEVIRALGLDGQALDDISREVAGLKEKTASFSF